MMFDAFCHLYETTYYVEHCTHHTNAMFLISNIVYYVVLFKIIFVL